MRQKRIVQQTVTLEKLYELILTLKTDFTYELEKRPTKFQIQDMITQLKSDFYNKVDPLLSEIENAREDRELSTYEINKINQRLSNHEKFPHTVHLY